MDSDQGKLFVGGISWETTEDALKDHFNKYGDVVDSVIMRDRNTGSARGFGFIHFLDPCSADKALQEKHVILGRTVEVKKAVPRGEQNQQNHHHHQQQSNGSSKNNSNNTSANQFRTKKIFVGGLSASLTEENFKSYFEKFGRITDVVVMYDSATHRPRGFGFITFDSEEAVENVMQKSFHELNDKLVEVKRAVPKDVNHNGLNNINNNEYGMRMGNGRGPFYSNYQSGIFPAYGPRYGVFHGYAPPPVSGYANVGGYPYGGNAYRGGYPYGGVGYGAAVAGPRSPWNGVGMVGARRSPASYGNAVYPGYANGGMGAYMGMPGGAYHGMMGAAKMRWNQGSADVHTQAGGGYDGTLGTTPPLADRGKLEDVSSAFGGNYGASTVKQNQIGTDGRLRLYTGRVA